MGLRACIFVRIGGALFCRVTGDQDGISRGHADKPVPDTAGSWKLTELESKDGRFVALAISGGGSRAANFGAAVMLELRRSGVCWNKSM